jgi:hypothetical protein
MMELRFKIENLIDAENAFGEMFAVVDAYRLLEDPDSFDAMKKEAQARARKVEPEPVAEPKPEPVVDVPAPRSRSRKAPPPPPPPAAPPATPPAAETSPEEARGKLVAMCRKNGIEWVRGILSDYGRAKISDLSDKEVADILAQHPAETAAA